MQMTLTIYLQVGGDCIPNRKDQQRLLHVVNRTLRLAQLEPLTTSTKRRETGRNLFSVSVAGYRTVFLFSFPRFYLFYRFDIAAKSTQACCVGPATSC